MNYSKLAFLARVSVMDLLMEKLCNAVGRTWRKGTAKHVDKQGSFPGVQLKTYFIASQPKSVRIVIPVYGSSVA